MQDWQHSTSMAGLVCRPALARDKQDMLALTTHIWDGHDYLPRVWDGWLLDSVGRLVVAEVGGQIVGLAKLTRLAPDQWWMEGLRVHPDWQGLGIASRLHEYLLRAWEKHGPSVLRLATSEKRLPVHHLCYRTGFEKVTEFSAFRAAALTQPVDRFSPVGSDSYDRALHLASAGPSMGFVAGLWDLGWQWAAPIRAFLDWAAKRGQAYWWRDDRGLLVVRIDEDEDDPLSPVSFVQILACDLPDLPALLQDYRRLAANLGYRQAGWMTGLDPGLLDVLEAAGFERTWDSSLYIFEKIDRSGHDEYSHKEEVYP